MNSADITREQLDKWREYVSNEFGAALSDEQEKLFLSFMDELFEWNSKFNLISARSAEEVLWRHFADSLAAVKLINEIPGPKGLSAADIGAGAGFPGIPVKIALPEMKLLLVDSIGKKCAFLENAAAKLSLSETAVFNGRAELLGQDPKTREKYDITLSRAAAKLSPNLESVLPLLKTGGHALIHKYENFEDEIKGASAAIEILGGKFSGAFKYRLPGSERDSFIISISKTGPTPEKYPRRPGMSDKKPL